MQYLKYTALLASLALLSLSATFSAASVPSGSVGGEIPIKPPTDSGAPPASIPLAVPATSFSTPFQFTNDKVVVQAKINGMGPYSLALDSGAETMMISQQVADACKLTVKNGTVELSGTSGSYVPVPQAMVDKLDVGGAVVNNPFCTVSPRPLSVDGYIGAPLFNTYTVQIDFGSHQITCYPTDRYKPDPVDLMVPMTFGKHRVPVVKGTIGGISANFEVDTGSTFPAELTPSFVQANDLSHKFQKVGSVQTNSVGGVAIADVYGAPTLILGSNPPLALGTNVPTLFQGPAVADWDGRIGAPVLSNFVLTFDYAHSRIYIRPTQIPSMTGPIPPTAAPTPPSATNPPTMPPASQAK